MGRYGALITEATGITDEKMLAEIEDCMRHDIFHSTLDWQTREQLEKAAREAVEIQSGMENVIRYESLRLR